MISVFVFALVFSTAISLVLNWILLKFSKNLGIRNKNSDNQQVRWAAQEKPALGGIAFFLVFLLSVSIAGFLPSNTDNLFYNQKLIAIIVATTVGFIIGLADDAYNTNPLVKFIGQFTCAFILILGNLYIEATGNLAIDYFITTLWVVGLMNSINMLDNMDAITTTASLTILASISFILSKGAYETTSVVLILGVIGALLGFLYFNWNPAKMYMGDSGSQFLGVFLAAASILTIWGERSDYSGIIQLKQFVLPLLIFTVPLMDTLTVTVRRLMRKQSPFVGGKDHTTHQLVFFGFTEKQTALILISIGIVSGVLACLLYVGIIPWTFTTTILSYAYFFLVFGIMQVVYNIGKKRHENA
ncbi:MAG: MraY family glycosyltransferase [Chitinophagales bacterium]